MTDDELESVQSGFAALAADPDDEDGPYRVHGVAIGEDDITEGASGTRTYWPRETLEAATEGLAGKKIVDDSEHDDLEATQPPVSAILGEVTQATYKPDVGVVFEGEIDDPDIAALVENGRVDVSPALFRSLGEFDDEREAHPAREIHKWRDLSVVAEGAAPSNTIQPGAAALQAEALAQTFESEADASTSDEPAESGADPAADADGADDDPEGASTASAQNHPPTSHSKMDLSSEEETLIQKARSLDDPTVVESDVEALSTEAAQLDEPALVEKPEYNQMTQRINKVRDGLAEALLNQTDLRAETISALSFEALWDEFDNDDDDGIDIAVLTQSPEAGGIGDEEDDGPTDDDINEIESLLNRATMMERHAPSHAESLRDQAADLADVDSHEDIDLEVL